MQVEVALRSGAVLAVGTQVQPQLLVHLDNVLFYAPPLSRSETPVQKVESVLISNADM